MPSSLKDLSVVRSISEYRDRINATLRDVRYLSGRIELLQEAVGRIEQRQLAVEKVESLADNEFKVFSQWGEDGILSYLVDRVEAPPTFVEFGVGSYEESNTRFLLKNRNWTGLVIDGDRAAIDRLRKNPICVLQDLRTKHAFIDRENINSLIGTEFVGEIGILSIDIDGNDYWIWETITVVQPMVVVVEYNSLFGRTSRVSTPYSPDFYIFSAHYSGLYWGASLGAFEFLAAKKGYTLVGSNSAGNNAFFVRNDVIGALKPVSAEDAHVKSKFRISRDRDGRPSYLDPASGLEIIGDMPVIQVDTGESISVRQAVVDRDRS